MQNRLNLATRPLENTRRFVMLAAAAGTVLLAALVFLSVHAFGTWKANREMREEVGRLQDELREFRSQRRDLQEFFKQEQSKRVMDRAAFFNGLIEERSFPWTGIFMDLERLLPPGARVINLAPRRAQGAIELRMMIGARDDLSKVRFLRALDDAPQFERVVVISESRKDAAGDDDPLELELVAVYRAEKPPAKNAAIRSGGQ